MTLDSTNDKQPETTDATPDSDTQATTDSATPPVITTEAATPDASEAAAAESHEAVADDEVTAADAAAVEADDDKDAEEDAADEKHAAAPYAATVTSVADAPRTSMPTKAIAAVLMLGFVAAAFIFIQRSSSKPVSYNLSKHDMEVIFQEMIPPPQQAQIASSPDEKKKLIDEVRKLLSVAAFAESEGYAQRPEVQQQLALQTDLGLNEAYRKKYPDTKVTDEDINAYYQAHPSEFDNFLQSNPQFQQRAQGAQRDQFKKQYGEFKVVADRARQEKLDQDEAARLSMLIKRADALNNAYLGELEKNADKLVSDDEVEKYYKEHQGEFEEVHVRHILISTQPPPPGPDAKKGEQPKALSKEEARKKAEEALAKARKGEDFAALVKQYSDDPGSKDKGGEYTFSKGQMVPEFEQAAFALQQPGQISDLVETQFGYHIIKLEERKGGAGSSDPKVRQQIVAKLKKDKIDAKIDEITKNSKVSVPDDFDMNVKPSEQPAMPPGHPSVQKQ
ncbi:MAG: peptidylprolyl isomerase [Blastocatellia bacterium]